MKRDQAYLVLVHDILEELSDRLTELLVGLKN